jgi:hypothetical protein
LTRSLAQQKVEEGNWRRIKMADLTRSLVYARDYFNHYGASSLLRPTGHEDPDRDEIDMGVDVEECLFFVWFRCLQYHQYKGCNNPAAMGT